MAIIDLLIAILQVPVQILTALFATIAGFFS
jgi:hypothetical protein